MDTASPLCRGATVRLKTVTCGLIVGDIWQVQPLPSSSEAFGELASSMSDGRFISYPSETHRWSICFHQRSRATSFGNSLSRIVEFEFSLASKDHCLPPPYHFYHNFSWICKSNRNLSWKVLYLDNDWVGRRGRSVLLVEFPHLPFIRIIDCSSCKLDSSWLAGSRGILHTIQS